jgi:hypothetical protein
VRIRRGISPRYDAGDTSAGGPSSRPSSGVHRLRPGSRYAILFRSTGLGKAELVGKIIDVKSQGDYLMMEIHTTEPVK